MTTIDTEEFVKKLNELRMTPEERQRKKAEELGKTLGKVFAGILLLLIIPTIIWAVLTYIFALNIAWAKVFGAYFLFNLFKNILFNSFKK
jgi:hypothetical protein